MPAITVVHHGQLTAKAAADGLKVWERADPGSPWSADFQWTLPELVAISHSDRLSRRDAFIAYRGDTPVGMAKVILPLLDNQHLMELQMRAAPDDADVLDALWRGVDKLRKDTARTTVNCVALQGLTGTINWLESHGFSRVHEEIISTLVLADAAEPTTSSDYELVSFEGATPENLVEPMCRLRERMSTDAPIGEADVEPEVWDVDRIKAWEAKIAAGGFAVFTAVALRRATGEAVAYTTLETSLEGGEFAYQDGTLVRKEDRGHGLGRAVKLENIRLLQRNYPSVSRIHTWNAVDNHWMLAINRDLGFEETDRLHSWQWRQN